MTRSGCSLLLSGCLLLAIGPAPQEVSSRQVRWEKSYKDVLAKAKAEGKPILVAFNMDGEAANDRAAFNIYHHPDFVAASRDFYCIIGSIGRHEEVPVPGEPDRTQCSRFGVVSCAQHRQAEIEARTALIGSGENIAPQHILLSPEGKILERRAYEVSLTHLRHLMTSVLIRSGSTKGLETEEATIASLLQAAERELLSVEKARYFQSIADLETPGSREVLLGYLEAGEDDRSRAVVARLLGRSGDFLALNALRKATQDKNPQVALAAVEALERLRLPGAAGDLRRLLRTFKEGPDHGKVLMAYAACAGDDEKVRKSILASAKSRNDSEAAFGLAALQYFDSSEEIVDVLGAALKSGAAGRAAGAAYSIARLRADVHRGAIETLARETVDLLLRPLLGEALRHLQHSAEEDAGDGCSCDLENKLRPLLAR